jgi:hypothetical protein
MYKSTEGSVAPSCSPIQTPRLARVALTTPHGAVDGRSPDLRINVLPNLPKPDGLSGIHRGHSPLTVAGAVTGLAPFGSASPYSLFHPKRIFGD